MRELKRAPGRTAHELASHLELSLNAVRHHLKELEAATLVSFDRERRGVGAPVFRYHLTESGEALFPQRYETTLLEVLDRIAERQGRDSAVSLLRAGFDTLAERLQPALAGESPERRLAIVGQALVDEGYMAEWESASGEGALTEHNCAIRTVAQRFPEVCGVEAEFLAATIGAQVERQSHILGGCSQCRYAVTFHSPVHAEKS
ncbi:MAG TPA: helix-turn-helix domain-containing protein [Gemmatimonadaceae bacterium]|nr:helix-turn-helix domain-containing protein [Gemmatimonadaceae bacterium]